MSGKSAGTTGSISVPASYSTSSSAQSGGEDNNSAEGIGRNSVAGNSRMNRSRPAMTSEVKHKI